MNLHPQLAADTVHVTDLKICRVLLMNNKKFPWLILVPMREGVTEIFDLPPEDYEQVMREVRDVTEKFAEFTGADKMNVATLGNVVPQLHIHVIARFKNDAAWPNPVWNSGVPPEKYGYDEAELLRQELRTLRNYSTSN